VEGTSLATWLTVKVSPHGRVTPQMGSPASTNRYIYIYFFRHLKVSTHLTCPKDEKKEHSNPCRNVKSSPLLEQPSHGLGSKLPGFSLRSRAVNDHSLSYLTHLFHCLPSYELRVTSSFALGESEPLVYNLYLKCNKP